MQIQKTDWDLSLLLKKEEDAVTQTEEMKKVHREFISKWKSREDYLTNEKTLKEALDELENIETNYGCSGNVGFYYHLKSEVEQSNSEIKAKLNKAEEVEKELSNNMKFFTLKISKISEKKQKEFLESEYLKDYKHYLERLFQSAKHTLSEEEEKIISLKETVSHDFWERLTSGLLSKQEKEIEISNKSVKKNFSELLSLTQNPNKQIRDTAGKLVNEILERYSEVAESEINAILMNAKINSELRKFSRPDEPRHLTDDISTETVDTLIKTVSENFHLSKRFYELQAKLNRVNKIKYYERATPYGEDNREYEYEEAVKIVHKTFSQLDNEFAEILEKFVKNSQIDVFPKKGKRSGAFCSHLLKTQPVYIMLNHDNSLKDVITIAHEVGHGINAEMMNKKQNSLNIGTPKSTAEVASTFMEDFVLEEILKNATERERLSILMQKLDGDISTIFRQVAFYNFEFELHTKFREKGYLSKKEIGEIFKKHMESYLGEFVDVKDAENWWIYIPHFRYIFYVYSYASGLLISKSLQNLVKKDKNYMEKVKYFLSAGTSESPENIFKNIGIEINKKDFWEKGLKEVKNLLERTEILAKNLGKI